MDLQKRIDNDKAEFRNDRVFIRNFINTARQDITEQMRDRMLKIVGRGLLYLTRRIK